MDDFRGHCARNILKLCLARFPLVLFRINKWTRATNFPAISHNLFDQSSVRIIPSTPPCWIQLKKGKFWFSVSRSRKQGFYMGEEDTVLQKPNYFNLLICHLGVNHLTFEWWWNFEKLVLGYFLTLSSTIANWGGMAMEPDKIFCCMFLFHFLALTVHETQYLCSLPTEEQTNRNVLLRYLCIVCTQIERLFTVVDLPT